MCAFNVLAFVNRAKIFIKLLAFDVKSMNKICDDWMT